jgi:hypothetical protein
VLDVRPPAAPGVAHRVADIVSEQEPLTANVTSGH